MKSIALKNGMVIFAEQIAFIHVQPSSNKDGRIAPEIHVHFSAGLNGSNGSRSMRAVIGPENSGEFVDQLEKYDVNCTYIRQCILDIGKANA